MIWQLKDHYVNQGKKVFVTTTTHMYRKTFTNTSGDARAIIRQMNQDGWTMAGLIDKPAALSGYHKIIGLTESCYDAVCEEADVVLVEADGAKHKSVKCPASWEPVLPSNVTDVYLILGTWDIGKPIGEVVHRWNLLSKDPEETLHPSHLLKIFEKYKKEKILPYYPEANIVCYQSSRSKGGIHYEKL